MIKITADTTELVRSFDRRSAAAQAAVTHAVRANAQGLVSRIRDKLSGQVLNVRSGALLQSITNSDTAAGSGLIGNAIARDGSAQYARIQEYGGRVGIPQVAPQTAKVLAIEYQGRLVFAKHAAAHIVDIPERSFMRSSLTEIEGRFRVEVRDAIDEALS
jgi:phage gpG-like protein